MHDAERVDGLIGVSLKKKDTEAMMAPRADGLCGLCDCARLREPTRHLRKRADNVPMPPTKGAEQGRPLRACNGYSAEAGRLLVSLSLYRYDIQCDALIDTDYADTASASCGDGWRRTGGANLHNASADARSDDANVDFAKLKGRSPSSSSARRLRSSNPDRRYDAEPDAVRAAGWRRRSLVVATELGRASLSQVVVPRAMQS
ncbi:hypothetical protein ACHAWF_017699 [Thalassiosira exigua]